MLLHTKRVNDNWTSEVYSRYGNHLYSWWYQIRKDTSARYSYLPHTLIENEIYILAYIRIEQSDITELGLEYMPYIGVQSHIHCQEHQMSLIYSTDRKNKCNCGRKEFYICSHVGCK